MGSPFSPIAANIFMEELKKKALEPLTLKPKMWGGTWMTRSSSGPMEKLNSNHSTTISTIDTPP